MTCKDCIFYNQCVIVDNYAEKDERDYFTEYGCAEFKYKADFVEVVRCKDCDHYLVWSNGTEMHKCDICDREVYADDFCSFGKRKEGAE